MRHYLHAFSFQQKINNCFRMPFLLSKEQSYSGFVKVKIPFHVTHLCFIKRKDHYAVSQIALGYREAFPLSGNSHMIMDPSCPLVT